MATADTSSDRTWNRRTCHSRQHPLASLLFEAAIKLCQPPERPSAQAILAATAINIHVRKTCNQPEAYRQDLLWATIPAKSSHRPGEPCLKFIPFFACIFERISPAPRAESNNHLRQTISIKHNPALALNVAKAMVEAKDKSSLTIKYLPSMASHSFFKHPNDLIEKFGPFMARLCCLPHSDCSGLPASAIGHA